MSPAEEMARLRKENQIMLEALKDVDQQFSAYEEDGKRYSGASVYLKINKVREALREVSHG